MTSSMQRLKGDQRILHLDDERSIGNGIIIMLKEGYVFYDDCGVIGADTPMEALREMKRVSHVGAP